MNKNQEREHAMKAKDFTNVTALMERRRELLEQIEGVSDDGRNGYLGMTFRGQHQRDDLLAVIREPVAAELGRRLAAVEGELNRLGVDLGDGPPVTDGLPE